MKKFNNTDIFGTEFTQPIEDQLHKKAALWDDHFSKWSVSDKQYKQQEIYTDLICEGDGPMKDCIEKAFKKINEIWLRKRNDDHEKRKDKSLWVLNIYKDPLNPTINISKLDHTNKALDADQNQTIIKPNDQRHRTIIIFDKQNQDPNLSSSRQQIPQNQQQQHRQAHKFFPEKEHVRSSVGFNQSTIRKSCIGVKSQMKGLLTDPENVRFQENMKTDHKDAVNISIEWHNESNVVLRYYCVRKTLNFSQVGACTKKINELYRKEVSDTKDESKSSTLSPHGNKSSQMQQNKHSHLLVPDKEDLEHQEVYLGAKVSPDSTQKVYTDTHRIWLVMQENASLFSTQLNAVAYYCPALSLNKNEKIGIYSYVHKNSDESGEEIVTHEKPKKVRNVSRRKEGHHHKNTSGTSKI